MTDYRSLLRERIAHTIIPAQPGWYLLRFITGGKDDAAEWPDYLLPSEVIAWAIERREYDLPEDIYDEGKCGYECIPLTVDGPPEALYNPWAIKSPNGRLEAYGTGYDTEAELLVALREEYDAEQKRLDEAVKRRAQIMKGAAHG